VDLISDVAEFRRDIYTVAHWEAVGKWLKRTPIGVILGGVNDVK
jgi:hypothetical protein